MKNKKEFRVLKSESTDLQTGETLKVTVEGTTAMPFWKHDLKLQAALELLETVDRKHFMEDDDNYDLLYKYTNQIRRTLDYIINDTSEIPNQFPEEDIDLGYEE